MRRGFVVLALLAMMVGLKALKAEAPGGADPLTLAAIGFVVLAAFAVAELGAKLQLPKVTGYILSGVVLGPYAARVLTNDVVVELEMFSTLALGLIATSAGLELDLKGLRALARTLAVTTAVKIVTGVLLVGGTVVAIELTFHVLGLASHAEVLAIAIVIAALSLGTSPSVTLAILSDTRAKGRLADLVLGAAVVKDVVVVVLLALAIATARSLTGGGGIGVDVLVHVGEELGASALAGGILGGLLILYVRFIKAEMLLFVAAMVLVVAQVGVVLRLDLLLVFIVAGVVVRNFSSYAHDLLHPLETVSLPVFIVFFTNAGANVDLPGLAAVLPLALAVCVARAIGYFFAGRIGGRAGNESPKVRRLAWLGYLPQAGVTLGLLGVAASQLPELAPSLTTIGMAVLAVNLLIGPVTLRAALRSAGEIPGQEEAVSEAAQSMRGVVSHGKPWEGLESEELQAIVRDVAVDGAAAARLFVAREVEPWVDERRGRLTEAVAAAESRDQALAGITEVLERLPPDDAPSRVDGLLALFAERVGALESIPARLRVPLERKWQRVGRFDPLGVALRKRWARFLDVVRLRWNDRERAVPARMTARTVVEPALARALEEVANAWYRAELLQLEELRRCALRTRTPQEAAQNLDMLARDLVDRVREDLVGATERMARSLAVELGRVGSPVHPASRVRYSKVEPELVRWRARITDDAESWARRRDAAARLVRVTAEVALIEQRLGHQLGEQVMAVAEEAFVMVKEEVAAEGRRLGAMVDTARAATSLDEETMGRLQMQAAALVPRPVLKKLRATGGKLRRATSGNTVATIFRDASIEQAGREAIVHSIAALVEEPRPARGEIIGLDIGETIQGYLSADLAPGIEDALGELWAAFAAAREAMGNSESAAEFVLSAASRESADEPLTPAELASQLESARDSLAPVAEATWAQWETLEGQLTASLGGIDEHLVEAIARAAGRSSASAQAHGRRRRLVVFLQAGYGRIAAPLSVAWEALVVRARGEAAHGIGRHYRLRSGAERADAADVRELLREYDPAAADLPAMYRALFSVDPVRDPRLFVAHREALQEVVRVERSWQQSPVTGNAVLVVAGTGMGKTSLVQVARLKLATRRVIVVPERDRVDEPALLAYVARELGCSADADAIAVALGRGRTAIVVDDLHTWLDLGPAGVRQLDELLSLVVATRASAFWLLAISREGLEAYEPLLPVRPAFAQVVRLRGVTPSELDTVVESRQQLAGLALSFPLGWWARLLDRVLRRSPRESYLRGLAAVSDGNLRRSLRGWLRRARLASDREIRLAPIGVDWGLPFVRQLSAAQLAVLCLLLRFGRRRVAEVADALAMTADHVARELRFLAASGLLDERGGWLDVPVPVRDEVAAALSDFGVLPGGES